MKCPTCNMTLRAEQSCPRCGVRKTRAAYPSAVAHFDRVLAYLDSVPANVEPLRKEIRMLRDDAIGGTTTAAEIDRKTTELEKRWAVNVNPYEPRMAGDRL